MPQDKKLPRFVPTLTEVVPGKPPIRSELLPAADMSGDSPDIETNLVTTKAMVAAEAFLAQRMPELVSQHMAACELQLRLELENIIKDIVEAND
jgi:hypothetical protein